MTRSLTDMKQQASRTITVNISLHACEATN